MKRWTPVSRSPIRKQFRRGGIKPTAALSDSARGMNYWAQTNRREPTPAQNRRMAKKARHAVAVAAR